MLLPAAAQIPNAFEGFQRAGKSEVYGLGQYLHSEDINFSGPMGDIKTKMHDTGLGGIGVAWHFNDFLSINGDFMFGSATFEENVPAIGGGTFLAKQDAFLQTGRFNITYNIINRRITPFLTAGIGYQYTSVELENAPPVAYWDPWYGWVYYSHPHAWQTDFAWNAAAGIRWNITDTFFIKAGVGATWLEYEHSHGITTQLEGIFAIGATF
jgi:opacity protein-like surface antigen